MSLIDLNVDDRVLCLHKGRYYEARIVDKRLNEKKPTEQEYLVHYMGWKSSYDEWVEHDLVREIDHSIEFSQSQTEEPSLEPQTKSQASPSTKVGQNSRANGKNTKKRKIAQSSTDSNTLQVQIPIPLPDLLKVHLVEDWERITKKRQLVPLPRRPCVKRILTEYKTFKAEGVARRNRAEDLCNEVVEGLIAYFDRALGSILLFPFERQQYLEILEARPEIPMSETYGGEHLLRLLVQLPSLFVHTKMDQESILALRDQLIDFIRWFSERRDQFLLTDYENAPPAYLNLCKAQ